MPTSRTMVEILPIDLPKIKDTTQQPPRKILPESKAARAFAIASTEKAAIEGQAAAQSVKHGAPVPA